MTYVMSLGLTHKRRTMKNHEVQSPVNLTMRDETKEKSTKKSNTKQISIKIIRMRFDIKKSRTPCNFRENLCGKKDKGENRERRRKKKKGDPHATHMYTHRITNKGSPRRVNTTREGGVPPPYDVARAP